MKLKFFNSARLADRVAERPSTYLRELEPCIVRRDSAGIWVDVQAPAWLAMQKKYARVRVATKRAKAKAKRDEKTRKLWGDLHLAALAGRLTEARLKRFANRIPCGDCREHWKTWTAENPISGDGFAWTVAAHNAVNRKLGKPELSVDEARQRFSGPSSMPRPASPPAP